MKRLLNRLLPYIRDYKAVSLGIIGLACAVAGWAFGVIICAVIAVLLCVFNRLNARSYPYLVFLLGLAFLYQTTLMSGNLIGTDIHTEYYIYLQSLDGWDTAYPHAYNTAFGTTVIAPFLTNAFGISGLVIYKAIIPFAFAFVPLILFYIYKKQFGAKIAFLSCIVFITLPTYLLEMIGLPRQMLGELMLALVMFLVINRPIRMRYLAPLLLLCAIGCYLFHYVVGFVVLMLLLGSFATMAVIKLIQKPLKFKPVQFPLGWMALVIVISMVVGGLYYVNVADGVVANSMGTSFFWLKYRVGEAITPTETIPASTTPTSSVPSIPSSTMPTSDTIVDLPDTPNYFANQEPLIRTALGLDFASASIVGKGFRIFQFGIQLSLIIGCVWLVFNRKRISAEYIGFAASSVVLLAACILLPRFSNIINVTRFYHIALFTLSPLIIVGMTILFKNKKVAAIVLLIPYMLYSTGAVFELAKEMDISKINAPYSIALSNYRLGIVGEYTKNDLACVDWVVENDIEPVLTDINGMLILSQKKDPYEYINRSPNTGQYYTVMPLGMVDVDGQTISELKTGWGYLPQDSTDLAIGCYIFFTERSMQTQTAIFKPNWYHMTDTASGMRQAYSFDYLKLPPTEIVYQSGDAVILKVKE